MQTTRTYDKLNRLTLTWSKAYGTAATNLPTSFAYQYNAANQRTRATLGDGSYWVYQYDALGQVTSGCRFWADGTPVAGQHFAYGFDDIGNRTTTGGRASAASTYTVNRLNQYSSRTVAPYVDVLGIANPTTNVTVNGTVANRKGEYFHWPLNVPNSTPEHPNLTIVSQYGATQTHTGAVYVAASTESFQPDADGNLVSDGRWSYTWDGENRLTQMIRDTDTPAGARQKLVFEYDHQGRRIRKQFSTYSGGWVEQTDTLFLYDGWNLVAELNANSSNARVRTYAWGTDLSGSMRGAAGVGGLLKVTYYGAATTNAFVAQDGNGNVAALVDGANGGPCARYEYGPFAEPIRVTGPLAKLSPLRFSTKYTDDESGLSYYGCRYYNPNTGRWPNRDPMGEPGFEVLRRRKSDVLGDGPNLYPFVGNAPVNLFDALGLTRVESGTWFPGSISDGVVYWTDVDDGQSGTVTLRRITMAEVEAEIRDLVNQLNGFEKRDGCKSRKYKGGFDSKYFEGENEQHQYYLVDGKGPLYADNEINYIGIGLCEAWLCNSLTKAKATVWVWKLGRWQDVPSAGTMHWLEVGYNNYKTIEGNSNTSEQHGRCCRCNTPSDRRDDPREPLR
jgi:RHS repeat-associated protein